MKYCWEKKWERGFSLSIGKMTRISLIIPNSFKIESHKSISHKPNLTTNKRYPHINWIFIIQKFNKNPHTRSMKEFPTLCRNISWPPPSPPPREDVQRVICQHRANKCAQQLMIIPLYFPNQPSIVLGWDKMFQNTRGRFCYGGRYEFAFVSRTFSLLFGENHHSSG